MKNIFLATAFASFFFGATAQSILDGSFGYQGIVRTDFTSEEAVYDNQCQQVLLHPDGSFSLVFEMNRQAFIVHRLANGSLDASYGQGGYSVPVFMRNPHAVLQSDGKIVLGGTALNKGNEDFALARYTSGGVLDAEFSGDGRLLTDFSSGRDDLFGLALQQDGSILAVGRTYDNSRDRTAIARYLPNGEVDNSFSGDGKLITGFLDAVAYSVAVQNDGKIIAAGSRNHNGVTSMAILRLNADGSPDNGFSGDGLQIITSGWNSGASTVRLQNDGKIIAGGYSLNTLNIMRFMIVRLNADGSYDNTFSDDGMQISDFGGNDAAIRMVVLQNDDKIVVSGFASLTGAREFAVGRYNRDGSLDKSFSEDGLSVPGVTAGGTYPVAEANSLVIQPDGGIIAAGSCAYGTLYAAVRLDANGVLDNSFDGDGILRDHKIAGNSIYKGMAVQPDGKILAAGTTGFPYAATLRFAIARYNRDGSLDASFSGDGIFTLDFGFGSAEAFDIAIQPDGKIVVAGTASNGSNKDFALVRLNPDGSLDTSFSEDGKVLTDIRGSNDEAFSISVQPDGKLVVAGQSDLTGGNYDFTVVRYTTNGVLDRDFSGDGITTTDFNGFHDRAYKVLIQPDAKILAAGTSEPVAPNSLVNSDIAVARYNSDGSPDLSFSRDGKTTTDLAGGYDQGFDAALLPDGRFVVGGGVAGDFALIRYASNGSPDSSYSGDGKVIFDPGANGGWIQSLAVQSDGTVIAGGYVVEGFHIDLVLSRVRPDGIPDPAFADNGKLIMDLGYGEDRIESLVLYRDRLYVAGSTAYGGQVALVAAFLMDCSIKVTIPDAMAMERGVEPNTIYTGYAPASRLILAATVTEGTGSYSYTWSNTETSPSVVVSPAISTVYSVTVTDGSGCSATASLLVNVKDIRCGNGQDKILVCQMPAKSSRAHVACISVNAVSAHLKNGGYLGECKSDSRSREKAADVTAEGLYFYPNPSYSNFMLLWRAGTQRMAYLVIRDVVGRTIERRNITANVPLQLGDRYRPGIYYAEISEGNDVLRATLIKRSK